MQRVEWFPCCIECSPQLLRVVYPPADDTEHIVAALNDWLPARRREQGRRRCRVCRALTDREHGIV